MRITHSDPKCGCAFCVVGRAADAGESGTRTAEQARELSQGAASMLLMAQRNADVAPLALDRVGELEEREQAESASRREAVH